MCGSHNFLRFLRKDEWVWLNIVYFSAVTCRRWNIASGFWIHLVDSPTKRKSPSGLRRIWRMFWCYVSQVSLEFNTLPYIIHTDYMFSYRVKTLVYLAYPAKYPVVNSLASTKCPWYTLAQFFFFGTRVGFKKSLARIIWTTIRWSAGVCGAPPVMFCWLIQAINIR